jgi:pSer/pThr/pTyr-binding forkhead associated (FHA) protein
MPRLILISPEFADQTCELPDGTFTLGRSPQNHIIVRDESVSAQHCELLVYGREVIVHERGSRNGTFINGVRVKIQRGVNHGQLLRFGRVEARLEIETPENDDATSITAMDHYRSMMPGLMQPAAHLSSLPIIFTPVKAGDACAATVTDVAPPPLAQPPAEASGEQTSGLNRPRMRRSRLWIGAGFAILTSLIIWLWRN